MFTKAISLERKGKGEEYTEAALLFATFFMLEKKKE
jgi:hypothetical protein